MHVQRPPVSRLQRPGGHASMAMALHVTATASLSSIATHGLLPSLGPRAIAAGESRPAIWLFPDIVHLEDALLGWADVLADEESGCGSGERALLAVRLPLSAFPGPEDYEIEVHGPIDAARIDVISDDVDSIVDLPDQIDALLTVYNELATIAPMELETMGLLERWGAAQASLSGHPYTPRSALTSARP